ncbi:hypothetical protein CL633_00595 [bacterium]|nr:hypothetical protein [bacterium]|tara:strand:- start:30605 stop:31180 length:576 start_codon:yes stop_codon:yes gene_type:complete
MKTILLIDGENFKGKITSVFKNVKKQRPKWFQYDFAKLLNKVLTGIKVGEKIFYFAKIKQHPKTIKKSKELIQEQRLLKTHLEKQGFKVILSGRVRGQMEDGFLGKKILVFKEKGVDVKIAVDMVSISCDKRAKQIILASSDSDLQPAIQEVKARNIQCIYMGFEAGYNKGLAYTTHRTILIRNSEVLEYV